MKILAVCTSSQVFGAETVLLSLLDGLRHAGHEVHPIVTKWTDGKFPALLRELHLPSRELPLGKISTTLRWPYWWWTVQVVACLPLVWWKFRRWTRELKPDLILLTSTQHVISLWPVLGNVPTALLTQFSPKPGDQKTEGQWLTFNRKVDRWIACSQYIKRRLESFGIAPEKVTVVKSATLKPDQVITTPTTNGPRTIPVIGIVGQIGAWKGHEDFLRAAHLLAQQGLTFTLAVFGDGAPEYKTYFDQLAAELGLTSRLTHHGYLSSKAAIYEAIDILAVPSRFEDPYPTVVMEAAAFGVPVVGSDRGGLPELIVDGETGFVVPVENPAALAEKFAILIQDPSLREKQRGAALTRAATVFQQERMIEDFTEMAQTLLSAPSLGH
jgi:glycosyltransferase involved in cell wall biosynthesis